jgi:predicted TPR repeat methyltransferase
MGRPDAAAKTYRRWVELEPDRPTARHLLAAATGDCIPVRASDDYVVELFDAFASDFDQRLARLDYQAPQLVCDAVRKNVIGLEKLGNVLDAGCGTGLCGPLLRPLVTTLVGVDLSAGMLAKAAARSVYDRLVVSELSAYMNAQLNQFDLVVSADTLCYFGDLQEPLAAASACLKAGGLLVFTVEALGHSAVEGTPHRLMSHGRYAHSRRYVCDILQFAGFEVLAAELATLRMELQHGVNGLVVSARKIGYSESCGRRPLP